LVQGRDDCIDGFTWVASGTREFRDGSRTAVPITRAARPKYPNKSGRGGPIPDSCSAARALDVWFHNRVGQLKGRIRRIAIVAVARKLLIALWRYLETGLVPDGAILKN
jgi:hypothetical protein